MLSNFDWIRKSRSGAELIATLRCLAEHPNFSSDEGGLGPPHSALSSPCQRCWTYPRISYPTNHSRYCTFCSQILTKKGRFVTLSHHSVIIWSYVNQLPTRFLKAKRFKTKSIIGAYVHDEHRFLVVLHRLELKDWLQELVMYHGFDIRGLLQIFPTTGISRSINMGDVLGIHIHNEANMPMDKMRVQFHADPYLLFSRKKREQQPLQTFEVGEFLSLLEMAQVFRTMMIPSQQKELYGLLQINDHEEAQFYWGRFLGNLDQEKKDMLTAWKIRTWSKYQINLLYELVDYAKFR